MDEKQIFELMKQDPLKGYEALETALAGVQQHFFIVDRMFELECPASEIYREFTKALTGLAFVHINAGVCAKLPRRLTNQNGKQA